MTNSLPEFAPSSFGLTQIPHPEWRHGDGAYAATAAPAALQKRAVDPNDPARTVGMNYSLLCLLITPRPVGLIALNLLSGHNLAPFSYFNIINNDPPMFVVGISGSPATRIKDTVANILTSGECTINVVLEWMIEAANYTCTDLPPGVDEFVLAGLTPQPSTKVKVPHVLESAFSVEARLVAHHTWTSAKVPGRELGKTLILEGIMMHVREDLTNDDSTSMDMAGLRPVARLGGNVYAPVTTGFDLPKPRWSDHPKQ